MREECGRANDLYVEYVCFQALRLRRGEAANYGDNAFESAGDVGDVEDLGEFVNTMFKPLF
jgi:hypothetical protein